MAERAQVTSIEALDTFRASLLVYLTKARPVLDEVSADVQRTRNWLEVERRGGRGLGEGRRGRKLVVDQREGEFEDFVLSREGGMGGEGPGSKGGSSATRTDGSSRTSQVARQDIQHLRARV